MNRNRFLSSTFLLLALILSSLSVNKLAAQKKPIVISSKQVTGAYIYDNQLWYIEDGKTKIFDLEQNTDITDKYKVYTSTFTPIAASGKEIWIINNHNLFVLSKIKTRRFNLPKKFDGLEYGTWDTYKNYLPIGQDSLLIRALANKAESGQAARMTKVDAVYSNGKLEEIIQFLPEGSVIDYIDAIFQSGSPLYITDSWQVHRKSGKSFNHIDLSEIKGTQSLSLGKHAKDGSLWLYQSGEGLIHIKNDKAKAYPYGSSGKMLKGGKIDFIGVLENNNVVIATDNEIWFMQKGVYYPFKTDYGLNKIKHIETWKNSVIVSTYEKTELLNVK